MTSDSGKEVFQGILDDYKRNFLQFKDRNSENLARSMALNSAIKRGKKISVQEMKNLIDRLFGCKNPNYSPNGQLTYYLLDNNRIQETFNIKT
jgi:DNA mismatch repair protein MutL